MDRVEQTAKAFLECRAGDKILGVVGADGHDHMGEVAFLDVRDHMVAHLGGNGGVGAGIPLGDGLAGRFPEKRGDLRAKRLLDAIGAHTGSR